jgi:hypothetical protein
MTIDALLELSRCQREALRAAHAKSQNAIKGARSVYQAKAKLFDKGGKQLLETKGTDCTLGDAASFAIDKLLARSDPLATFACIVVEIERQP